MTVPQTLKLDNMTITTVLFHTIRMERASLDWTGRDVNPLRCHQHWAVDRDPLSWTGMERASLDWTVLERLVWREPPCTGLEKNYQDRRNLHAAITIKVVETSMRWLIAVPVSSFELSRPTYLGGSCSETLLMSVDLLSGVPRAGVANGSHVLVSDSGSQGPHGCAISWTYARQV